MVRKKYVRILVMLALGITLVLASSSCSKKESSQPPEPDTGDEITATADPTHGIEAPKPDKPDETPVVSSDGLPIILGQGVGPVKFGMPKEQVIEYLGEPGRMEGGGIAMFYLETKGISLVLSPRLGVQEINCWSKEYPKMYPDMPDINTFVGKTIEGIGMGAGREQIVAAYGEPDKTDSRDPFAILHYARLRTQFWLVQNKLVNIKMRGGRASPAKRLPG
jgi:hypothetical protein